MVEQSKVGIARPAVDGALVLEYEDMLTGKSAKLSRSQCLRPGREEIPKVRRLPDGRVPQICSIGAPEEQCVLSTGGPLVCLLQTSTSGTVVVELTSPRVDSPPRRVGNRHSLSNNDSVDVIDPKTEGISFSDLEGACSRVSLESAEVLMHIVTNWRERPAERIEPPLQSQGSKQCRQ